MKNNGIGKVASLPLVLLCVNVMLYFIAVGMNESIIARYTAYLGGDPFQVGFIWSALFLTSILLRTISGYISDYGYRVFMLISGPLIASLGAYIIGSTHSFTILAIGRMLQGVATAVYVPASISSASILSAPEVMGRVLGIRSGIISIGFMIGPILSGFIVDNYGYYAAFTFITLMFNLAIIPAIFLAKKVETRRRALRLSQFIDDARSVLGTRSLLLAIIVTVMYTVVYATISSFLQPIYLEVGLPATAFSLYMTLFNAIGIPAKLLGGWLSDHYGPLIPITSGLTNMTVASILLVYYPYPPIAYVSAVLLGLGFSPLIPATQYLALSNIPREKRGIATGFHTMGFDLGNLLGPLSLGKLAQYLGEYVNVFPILPLFTVTALILSIILCKPRRDN
ncbi:MAG: hypothetical protein DRO40_12430 [Thermoprotei archaeon]|nr:MAG: hypothetical protein DRO40_12430 [Thermoprotei archaeon]